MRRAVLAFGGLALLAGVCVAAWNRPRTEDAVEPDLAAVVGALEVAAPTRDVWLVIDGPFGRRSHGEVPEVVALGSVRKWTTAAVILMLVDEGRVDLDAPVAELLPAWDHRPEITLRHLLAHTSGLPPRPRSGTCAGRESLGACVDQLATLEPSFRAGERFGYSTLGYQVAARAAEVAAGRPWEELFARRLAEPLGWEGWRFDPVGEGLAEMDGTLWARPEDLLSFVALVDTGLAPDGRRLLSDAAVRELERGQAGAVPKVGPIPRWEWWARGDDPHAFGAWRARDEGGRPRFLFAEGRQELLLWTDRGSGVRGVMRVTYARRTRLDERMLAFGGVYALCAQLEGEVGGLAPSCLPWVANPEQLRTVRACLRGRGARDICLAAGLRTP